MAPRYAASCPAPAEQQGCSEELHSLDAPCWPLSPCTRSKNGQLPSCCGKCFYTHLGCGEVWTQMCTTAHCPPFWCPYCCSGDVSVVCWVSQVAVMVLYTVVLPAMSRSTVKNTGTVEMSNCKTKLLFIILTNPLLTGKLCGFRTFSQWAFSGSVLFLLKTSPAHLASESFGSCARWNQAQLEWQVFSTALAH